MHLDVVDPLTCRYRYRRLPGMPYIITTHRPGNYELPIEMGDRFSRRAVATLEQAQDYVHKAGGTYTAAVITEQGGTVGPLSDGTVIEVWRMGWGKLAHHADHRLAGLSAGLVPPPDIQAEIIN